MSGAPEQIIGRIVKNDRAEVRVTLMRYKGRPVANVRVWERVPGQPDVWRSTRKGVAFDARKLRDLVEQLEGAELPVYPSERV